MTVVARSDTAQSYSSVIITVSIEMITAVAVPFNGYMFASANSTTSSSETEKTATACMYYIT